MKLTVGQLKKILEREDFNDNTPVFIERVEDIYFEKYSWKTETLVFQRDKNGEIMESAEIFQASQVQGSKDRNKLIIYAHY